MIVLPANYVLLERIELNASAASVTFANIPQSGYTDLKIVMSARGTQSQTYTGGKLEFNGVTTGYSLRQLYGSGSAAFSGIVGSSIPIDATGSTATANTFNNCEIYIPNYLSSNYKSVSIDNVTENNATEAYTELYAGLWSNTAAITSLSIIANSTFTWLANSTFSLYGLAATGTTPVIAPKASGGNLIENDGTYWIHTFTSTGTFTPLQGLSCDYLVVAGGGGSSDLAGGGAGGYRTSIGGSPLSVVAQAYTITVGAGGAGTSAVRAAVGSNSVFSTITSTGGGGGGSDGTTDAVKDGGAGGSGGGGGVNSANSSITGNGGAASPSGQGNAGGTGRYSGTPIGGGGGGGAGAVGGNHSPSSGNVSSAGNGGAGLSSSISGTSITYAGGGGGGGRSVTPGTGGSGGGGAGSVSGAGTPGTANTGGGGGGSNLFTSGVSGGSGVVIIRYPIA